MSIEIDWCVYLIVSVVWVRLKGSLRNIVDVVIGIVFADILSSILNVMFRDLIVILRY